MNDRLDLIHQHLNSIEEVRSASPCILILSSSDGENRAAVRTFKASCFESAWLELHDSVVKLQKENGLSLVHLRVDCVARIEQIKWVELKGLLAGIKRNYFSRGIALDPLFKHCFVWGEINGNALLYPAGDGEFSALNVGNFHNYARKKYGKSFKLNHADNQPVWLFDTESVYCGEDGTIHRLASNSGPATGARILPNLDAGMCADLVTQGSEFLARQVKDNGMFVYGMFPCFNREIPTYNTLRHASSTYAMLEAWELTRSDFLKSSIDRSLQCLTTQLVKRMTLAGGIQVAFLVDTNNEIKLGGNAVTILALAKYTELTGSAEYIELMELLAQGIVAMLNPTTKQFVHVLNYPELTIKDQFRIIYYDGEAAFALMRLYKITRRAQWLMAVELAFDYFIAAKHWKANDHWLSYCVNELTQYRPKREYFEFGIRNFANHLDFVLTRITTFPTLLELMMAAEQMLSRLKSMPEFADLYAKVDTAKFYRAMHWRANYLLTGFFWPEWAMYFAKPDTILGSFFIRHHAYRVRIDDVEHYLSGLVAYRKFLLHTNVSVNAGRPEQHSSGPTLAWAGDVNLGRRLHHRAGTLGLTQLLAQVPTLKTCDLTVLNLECVVSNLGEQGFDKGESGPFYYRARPEMLNLLVHAGVDVVCTANNHAGDYGQSALTDQLSWLRKAGLQSVGSGLNRDSAFSPVYRQVGDVRLALFNFDMTQARFAASDSSPGIAYLDMSQARQWQPLVQSCFDSARKQADLIVVALHWGKNWSQEPDEATRACARVLVDSGANLLLGASAHVLQCVEVYRNTPVVYDAGDFLFDSIRKCVNSGVFVCELSVQGVRNVEYIPVGSEYGYTREFSGAEAVNACLEFEAKCTALGTVVQNWGERVVIGLSIPMDQQARSAELSNRPSIEQQHPCLIEAPNVREDLYCVDQVPDDAVLHGLNESDSRWGPLRLLGARIQPRVMNARSMLWIETFWTTDQLIADDARLNIRAHNTWDLKLANWGQGMEHDPCDWMVPTSRWIPGKIYRDFIGLRPPASNAVKNGLLHVKMEWVSPLIEKRELVLQQLPVRVLLKHAAQPVDLNVAFSKLSVWFLNQDMAFQRTGVENAALLRNQVFVRELNASPIVLTSRYNPGLHESIIRLKARGAWPTDQTCRSVYDFLQEAEHCPAVVNTGEDLLTNPVFQSEVVKGTRDIRVNDLRGQRVMYIARNPVNDALDYINHFCNGVKFRKDRYDCRGFLSCIQYLHESLGTPIVEHFLRPDGSLAVAKYFRLVEGKMMLQNIRLHSKAGDLLSSLPNEQALVTEVLAAMLIAHGGKHVLIVDKNRVFYKPAILAQNRIHRTMPNSVAVVPVIHAVHTSTYTDLEHGPTNGNFRDILHDIQRPDAIVTLTERQKVDIQSRYGEGRVFCIGHSYERTLSAVPFALRDRFRVVSMARYSPEKNQHFAIEAFAKVLKKYPQASLDFYGFGNAGDPTLPALQARIQALGLTGRVRLNGWAANPAEHYESAGLSLLTSQGEAFSLTIMESICHACPPVAFDVPYGPSHLIDHGETGLLVPFGDVDSLANAILSVFDDPAYHAQMSERGREQAQCFKPVELARRWCSLFESLGVSFLENGV